MLLQIHLTSKRNHHCYTAINRNFVQDLHLHIGIRGPNSPIFVREKHCPSERPACKREG